MDKVNKKYSMNNLVKSSQEIQVKVGKAYLHLKYFLFVGNLISSILKIPEFYKMISLVVNLLNSSKNDSEKSEEPPRSIEMLLNIALLYIGFFTIIVEQILISYKILKKKYNCLIIYLVLFFLYLFFLMNALFAELDNSPIPFRFALFMVKVSLFNYKNIVLPNFWWHVLFKTSIIIDILLFFLTIVFYVLITKLKSYTINRKMINDQSYSSVCNV